MNQLLVIDRWRGMVISVSLPILLMDLFTLFFRLSSTLRTFPSSTISLLLLLRGSAFKGSFHVCGKSVSAFVAYPLPPLNSFHCPLFSVTKAERTDRQRNRHSHGNVKFYIYSRLTLYILCTILLTLLQLANVQSTELGGLALYSVQFTHPVRRRMPTPTQAWS